MPERIDDCAKSILDDNPGMDESTAYAICNDMDNKGVLEAYLDADPKDTDADTAALAQFRNPGDIQRVKRNGDVVYKRVMLLSPGTWTDAGSETTVEYTPEGIRESAENFVDIDAVTAQIPEWQRLSNDGRADALEDAGEEVMADAVPINFLHGPSMHDAETLDEIGEIPAESVIVDDQGRLYGDIVLHGDSAESETAINLMDDVLEAAQDPEERTPPVGPSVEIPADRVTQADRGPLELQEAWFSAVGIVFNPASRPVELGTQAQQRAVAMASPGDDNGPVGPRALQGEAAVHEPEHTGTITGAPDEDPDMDDFDTDDLDTISDHAVASLSGFPPDDYDDLLGFVVTTDGDLSLPLLRETAASLAAAELSDESAFMGRLPPRAQAEAWDTVAELAVRNFGDAVSDTLREAVDGDRDLTAATYIHTQRQRTRTLLSAARHRSDSMTDDLTDTLADLERTLGEIERELQDLDMVEDLVESALEADIGTDDSVAELVEYAREEMDVDEEGLAELQAAADAYLQAVDAESLDETTVGGMVDWIGEAGMDEEGGDEGETDDLGDDEEMDETAGLEELEKVKDTIGTVAEHMGDIKDMLQAREAEREETIEELERRLQDVEDEPQRRSLTEGPSGDFVETDGEDTEKRPDSSPML